MPGVTSHTETLILFLASSYSKTKGTERFIANNCESTRLNNLKEAPLLDLKAETMTVLSIRICGLILWYYG